MSIVRWVCPKCANTIDDLMAKKPTCNNCRVRMHAYKIGVASHHGFKPDRDDDARRGFPEGDNDD